MQYTNPLNPILTNQPKQDWGRLYGSSAGLVISQVAQKSPLIVITPDSMTAQRLLEDIQFYAQQELPLLTFPDWETLPYDMFSPHQDIISARLTTLYHLPDIETGILVLPISTLMYRLAPTDYVRTNSLLFSIGQLLNPEKLRQRLEANGYRWVEQVVEHGEFLIRGSIIDLFPMGCEIPYRIDLFDNEIDTIRSFDPETQRSHTTIEELRLLPARELPLNSEAIANFQNQWHITGKPTNCPIYKDIATGLAPAGIEYYLPLFFNETSTLFNYLPNNSTVVTLAGTLEAAEQFWQEINERYEQLRHDIERPILPPSKLFLPASEVFAGFANYSHIKLKQEPTDKSTGINFATQLPAKLPVDARATKPLLEFQNFLAEFSGRVLLVAETTGRRESLLELLRKYELIPELVANWWEFLANKANFCLTVAPLEHGLWLEDSLAVITETQLFGERVAQRRRRNRKIQRDADAIVRDLTELTINAPIVHEEYGIGRYHGLTTLTIGGMEAEFLQLEYAKQDRLYVPVSSLHLISRFTGMDPEHAPLHKLGTNQWEKAKQKAIKKVTDVAAELLDIYAKREARAGQIFKVAPEDYQAFAQTFPFEETPDQQEAITEVLNDMSSNRPMDRLICGDVGFGKTEVAMRAALIAVLNSQQVAILVPTTLLCQQHYQTFQDRFADWPVVIKQLSRFVTPKTQKEIIQAIQAGQVDIVIGTHKLLNKSFKFKQLGLVIIDEEHRFGVRQKDRFKALRAEVDILTLTATPIPRSLNMALANLRDLSVITTPPTGRLAVKTFIREWQNSFIKEAILRELKRGGQVFFLHNNVDTINGIALNIQELVPEARVQIGHGQMRERELEQVMQDFYHRRFNVLVCTTIIETGIDIPTANTIIINRADKLGLAQLYQLRGRVGRSHHRAYAYLIVPARKSMTKDARKRIDAIEALDEVGMGFSLATQDLEIRGAGELLGDDQSGFVQEIGYNLYTELLERAVASIKSGQPMAELLANNTEVDLHVTALLPETYLYDIHTRLIMYKRIANAPDIQALDDIQVEMIDRFGLLPEPAKNLIIITELKLKAMPLGIRKLDFGEKGGSILFMEKPPINPQKIIELFQKNPVKYQLRGENKIILSVEIPEFKQRCIELEAIFKQLKSS